MIKKQLVCTLVPFFVLLIFTSCKSSRQLGYFKDLPDTASVNVIASSAYQPLRLQKDDEVQVIISSPVPEASQFYNLMTSVPVSTVATAAGSVPGSSQGNATTGQNFANLYRVGTNECITLPILGDIKATGLTTDELKAAILEKLQPHLKDPTVMVRLTNFKVTVIGEVGRPVVVPVNGQSINVLEAVGAAGDMTVFGIRKNVKVIRKLPSGVTEVAKLDFNKSSVLQSPYFELKQNDVVYIQPSKNKGLAGSQTGIWVSIFSGIASVTAIILSRTIK